MFKRTITTPKVSFFLFGPRQVGKSTYLKEISNILYVDLLDTEKQLAYSKTPNLLEDQIDALDHKGTIIIDEIQKVPQLLDVLHKLIEKYPSIQFIMSGSSARKLRHGAANLLGGRALYRTMHPLTLCEMGQDFDLGSVLSYGSLPKIKTCLIEGDTTLAQELLRTYVITYLKEEIKSEALVRNLQGFQNFLDVAVAQFAEQVNFNGISRDCQVAHATVREYYGILEDTLIGFFLYPYIKSVRKRMSHQPRFYFFDNGVTRALLGTLKDPPSPLEKGRLFEQWFVQEIYRLNEYHQKDWKLYFWRTTHGAEVDLLIEKAGKLIVAIECKAKINITKTDLSGLEAFDNVIKNVPRYVVAPVKLKQKIGDVLVIPPDELLHILTQS